MSERVARLVGNPLSLGGTAHYAGIIGERPSRGARSPALWNAVLAAEGLDARFHPFDVSADGLPALVEALKSDPAFVGGAVTVPHKTAVVGLLDRVEPVAARIGAVNCLYRDGTALVGANSDGAAAVAAVEAEAGRLRGSGRRVLVIGAGGAGAAVAACLAEALGEDGALALANRQRPRAEELAQRIGGSVTPTVMDWPVAPARLAEVDILVNCTRVGFGPDGDRTLARNRLLTPLSAADDPRVNFAESLDAIERLPGDALVFDIVYQPRETMLLQLARGTGRRALGGLGMNLEQAVIAFARAFPSVEPARIRGIMAGVP